MRSYNLSQCQPMGKLGAWPDSASGYRTLAAASVASHSRGVPLPMAYEIVPLPCETKCLCVGKRRHLGRGYAWEALLHATTATSPLAGGAILPSSSPACRQMQSRTRNHA